MNTIQNNGENDSSLKDGLDKISRAYEQLPPEEPPELLDQAVLSSAHRAVEKKPHWMQFGWLHGLTTTAVVVLALSLIYNQTERVPDPLDAIRTSESAGLERERAAKKLSTDTKSDLRAELKEANEKHQAVQPSAPVPAAAKSEAMEIAVGEQTRKPVSAGLRSPYSEGALKSSADKDASDMAPALEESLTDEADLVADVPEHEVIARQSIPATVATPVASEMSAPVEMDIEIKQRLLAIIELKQSGDEMWITELAKFKQDYPDYPLPDELSE